MVNGINQVNSLFLIPDRPNDFSAARNLEPYKEDPILDEIINDENRIVESSVKSATVFSNTLTYKNFNQTQKLKVNQGELPQTYEAQAIQQSMRMDHSRFKTDLLEKKSVDDTKQMVKKVVHGNVLKEININKKLPVGDGKTYFSKNESIEYSKKIESSHVAIHFERKYLKNILENGYVHWSQLKVTENTKNFDLFISRLEAEFSIFDVKSYNENILKQAESLMKGNNSEFVDQWNESFKTNFPEDVSVKDLFEKTGFQFVGDEVYYGAIYGALVDENQEMIGDKKLQQTIKNEAEKKGSGYYGKSQILIDKAKYQDKITFCLGDTFDAQIENYAWKTEKAGAVNDKKMVIFGLEDKENLVNRLQTCTKDSLSYIEAHLHFKVTPQDISRIYIDSTESSGSDEDLSDLANKFSVNIQKK